MNQKVKKTKYDIPIKHTIPYKITILILAVMVLALLCAGIFSGLFMEKFYTASKQNKIKDIYKNVNKLMDEDADLSSEDTRLKINSWCEKYGASIACMDEDGNSVYVYGSNDRLTRRWKDSVFEPNSEVNFRTIIIENNKHYTLTLTEDIHTNNKYYELISKTTNDQNDLVIQLSVENFKESIAIANKFMLFWQ